MCGGGHVRVWMCKIEGVSSETGGGNDSLGKRNHVERAPLTREEEDTLFTVHRVLDETVVEMFVSNYLGVVGAEVFIFVGDRFGETPIAHLARPGDLVEILKVKGRDRGIFRDTNTKEKVEDRVFFEVTEELDGEDVGE